MQKIAQAIALAMTLAAAATAATAAEDRMPPIPADNMTAAQKAAVAALSQGAPAGAAPRTVGAGPWVPLLRSPELLNRIQRAGAYLRYESALEPRLSEFVILMTARHWSNQYEWFAHERLALKAGLKAETAKAVAEGRRPANMEVDEEIVYDFITELHRNRSVSDATYQRVQQKFGDRGVIDLVGLDGYYATLAAIMNVAQTPLPPNTPQQMPVLPR
ncbi:carboxymuconolactone decarboxylase family protein [Xylophilus sp. GOD-11R]|uniref:carboxymuconolactone decarboxylase family protein n=1 Tax=Xylophilus sp. GOD-11R TaxID=3089814 RepID=UPI00298D5B78|nr:carboxymuconolactone decarboxylase family protein [Xylophilus sp. GOD-11R]WPB57729.1 carboxymuconolactone decarboxylase family protein [Xylophilus sp. GOD-11R]